MLFHMQSKKHFIFIAFLMILVMLFSDSAFAAKKKDKKSDRKSDKPAKESTVNEKTPWTHTTNFKTKDDEQEVRIKATYYSNEYVENLVQSEAEKNLWTQDEMENYKYTLLKNLNLSETIPIHLSITVYGLPVYAQPFDKHIHMVVGKNRYEPVDYDRRFNFRMIGDRDGLVHFPRYDPKTGKEILSGAKDLRIVLDSSISTAISSRGGDVIWIWDLSRDRGGVLNSGKAATRLEIDRLLKRLDKLKTDRDELQKQLDIIDNEYNQVSSRIEELQAQ